MTFLFKQLSKDFRVSEELPFTPTGKWDAFYVYIEKQNMTTQELIDHIRKTCNLSRMSIGIAGLKDKKAIARQWISIYNRALRKAWGEKVFVEALAQKVKILETTRHAFPLNLSTPITNRFALTFRANKHLGQGEKEHAKKEILALLQQGYPNAFGDQRFGIGGRNSTQGREILHQQSTELAHMKKHDIIFKIQAYASQLFNEYIDTAHISPTTTPLDGTILTWDHQGKIMYGVYIHATQQVHPVSLGKSSWRS